MGEELARVNLASDQLLIHVEFVWVLASFGTFVELCLYLVLALPEHLRCQLLFLLFLGESLLIAVHFNAILLALKPVNFESTERGILRVANDM